MRQFNWQAFLKGGKKISQFSPTGEEILFRTIQEEEKKGNLVRFHLIHQPQNPSEKPLRIGVDLITGSFVSNFLFEEEFYHPMPNNNFMIKYRLIYYRRRRGSIQCVFGPKPKDAGPLDGFGDKWQLTKEGDYWGWVKDETKKIIGHTHRYLLGWQTTFEGMNYQRILFLDPVTLDFEIKEKR